VTAVHRQLVFFVSLVAFAVVLMTPASNAAATRSEEVTLAKGSYTIIRANNDVKPTFSHGTWRFSVSSVSDETISGSARVIWSFPSFPEAPYPPYDDPPVYPVTSYENVADMQVTCFARTGNDALVGVRIVDSKWEQEALVGVQAIFAVQDGPDMATWLYGVSDATDCQAALAERWSGSLEEAITHFGMPVQGVIDLID
jgi:hypothetical protein